MSDQPMNYQNHQDLIVEYRGQEVRFWLPRDRPILYLIRSIVEASQTHSIFANQLDPQLEYDFVAANNSKLDSHQNLRSFSKTVYHRVRLVRRNLPRVEFKIRNQADVTHTIRLSSNMVIGYAKSKQKDKQPDLDLSEFAHPQMANRISHRHAIVFGEDGEYFLKVMHSNGVNVGAKRYEKGEVIRLENGMRLTIVEVNLEVNVRENQDE